MEIRSILDSPRSILEQCQQLDEEDLSFIEVGISLNRSFAREGLAERKGLGYGHALLNNDEMESDLRAHVKGWVSAGVEARMSGFNQAVMTSGGSGNSGLTVTLGPWAASRTLKMEEGTQLARAVALAHLFNIALKARIGRVGPLCGGSISSALGVGCAIAYLMGGDHHQMDLITRFMINTQSGVICDGAKPACAFKIAGGLNAAIDAAALAMKGQLVVGSDGLGGICAQDAFYNLSKLARSAYANTDICVTSILHQKAF